MKVKYICEKCGTMYDTAEAANKCEAVHGEIIEAHVMPGEAYTRDRLRPDVIYARFRNKKGEEEAAQYHFMCYESTDFETVKREHEEQ